MKTSNLTKGPILRNLVILALPLILANLMQMAYNFTDMYWIGLDSAEGLTALGTAGNYIWMSTSVAYFAKTGTEVLVGQAFGAKNAEKVRSYAQTGVKFAFFLSLAFAAAMLIFGDFFIEIFSISSKVTETYAITYLKLVSPAIFLMMMNSIFMSIFQALGNTKIVFLFTAIGLVINMVLDPLFIIYFETGVAGAALATIIANVVTTILFIVAIYKKTDLFDGMKLKIDMIDFKEIFKIGRFVGVQNVLFTGSAMLISRVIIEFGDEALAAQRVGSQLESFSWMVTIGIATSISVFISQNFGARQYRRMSRGFFMTTVLMTFYGIAITAFFYIFSADLIGIFTDDVKIIQIGAVYMKIIAISQTFMIIEGVTGGFFNGIGKAKYPAFYSISGNIFRLVMVFALAPSFGLNGIWFAIAISSMYKGVGLFVQFIVFMKKDKNFRYSDMIRNLEVN